MSRYLYYNPLFIKTFYLCQITDEQLLWRYYNRVFDKLYVFYCVVGRNFLHTFYFRSGKKYGETVVFSDLNYTFENACIYGLVGRNGAGKTTLLNILSNYDKNYTGVISIDGEKMNKVDYLDMPVAYAMDQPSFFNELTIYENLLLIASSRKIKKQEAFDKIERILDGLGLKKYENYSPLELSKGTMQRLNNACAMIQEEKITIFDEPFSGLDPVQMKLLENVIVEFHKKEKGIYIISSHDIECLQNVCDKCLLLHNGQIREINMEEVDREEIAKILSEGE